MAVHLLEGLFYGTQNTQRAMGSASDCWRSVRCRPG